MQRNLLLIVFLLLSVFLKAQVQIQFITVNQYGNNLYIDNVSAGTQLNTDVAVVSINNIIPNVSYSISSNPFIIAPNITIANVGKNDISTPFTVTLTVTPGVYQSVRTVTAINSRQTQAIIFDDLTITPGQSINLSVTANLSGDQNALDNTLSQYSSYLPGVKRTVLFEEWTSSTCAPCASNNPTVDAFIGAHYDSLVAIKYHMNWPSPGNDPMYAYNSTQANDRRYYYAVSSVPHVIADGVGNPTYPYTIATSLPDAFNARKKIGTPLALNVTTTRTGDTIQANVTVNIVSPLTTGNYYLRLSAVQRAIHYASAPGTNGEKDFYDVFRKAYPTSLGTLMPTAVGTYQYTFKYALDLVTWVDTAMYTTAFIQNDDTKEVLNASKTRWVTLEKVANTQIANEFPGKPIPSTDVMPTIKARNIGNSNKGLTGNFFYCLFENQFPSAGWSVKNPDGKFTFEQYTGVSGPSIGGNKAVLMDFYDYSQTNSTDTLFSPIYQGLTFSDSIKFDYSYSPYTGYNDRLIVKLSTDGGITFPLTIFDKTAAALGTAPSTTNSFVPTSPSQWATFAFPLMTVFPHSVTASVNIKSGWNMLSVPVQANDMTASTLFPNATSLFYGFSSGYSAVTTLANGNGYWSRFDSVKTFSFTGNSVNVSTIPVAAGWNLIGAYDQSVTVSSITSTPASIINSSFFGYDNGYILPTSLSQGNGYWVRVSQAGTLNLSAVAAKYINPIQNEWVKVTVRDNNSNETKLYLAKDETKLNTFDMPPMPPTGVFDARFISNRFVESINTINQLKFQSSAYPVTIQVDGGNLLIKDLVDGKFINRSVKNGDKVVIADQSITQVTLSKIQTPNSFGLKQNYPNPFNPSTVISYEIPTNSIVKLKIFDLLGKEVADLINAPQEAGTYSISVSLDSYGLTSGVYLYQLQAGSFVQTKKMVILK